MTKLIQSWWYFVLTNLATEHIRDYKMSTNIKCDYFLWIVGMMGWWDLWTSYAIEKLWLCTPLAKIAYNGSLLYQIISYPVF